MGLGQLAASGISHDFGCGFGKIILTLLDLNSPHPIQSIDIIIH